MLPAFPPVQIGGRLLGDAGLSANLPLGRGAFPCDAPWLTVYEPIRSAAQIVSLESVRLSLAPLPG